MESSEEIREALLVLQRENDRLRTESAHAKLLLSALESLLRIDLDDDPFPTVFASLRNVFAFEQAMVLAKREDDVMLCIAAEPPTLVGLTLRAARFFKKVMGGKVVATFSNGGIAEWQSVPPALQPASHPALYLPIRVRDERGVLVLIRTEGRHGFDRNHVVLAQQFALLASHALAARQGRQMIRHNEARAIAAEEASRAKNLFVANMSHELRTPLNAIIGFSEFMASEILGPLPNEQYREYTRHILSSGHHLLAIVNNLLLFARIEAGQHTTQLEPVRLEDELAYACRMFEFECAERGVHVVRSDPPEGLEITADRQSLRQILLNLISNALKFSPRGARVRVELTGPPYALRVIDHGCGIPSETLTQLGNPFVQAEGVFARKHQGTGLGLAICFGLAEAMGARIAIDSAVGVGTTVTLHLPTGAAAHARRTA